MGIQDTGCLNWVPAGYGLVREINGRCSFYQDTMPITTNFRMREFHSGGDRPYGVMRKLVTQLQHMRNALGAPIIITSG